jgi:hypothetical protein
MAAVFTYNGNVIHTSTDSETITFLTNNLLMTSNFIIANDENTTITLTYNGSTILSIEEEGVFTLNCNGKLMNGNIVASVVVSASGNYDNVMVISSSGTITLPNKSAIKVVLIGGGNGGNGGNKGSDGSTPTYTTSNSYSYTTTTGVYHYDPASNDTTIVVRSKLRKGSNIHCNSGYFYLGSDQGTYGSGSAYLTVQELYTAVNSGGYSWYFPNGYNTSGANVAYYCYKTSLEYIDLDRYDVVTTYTYKATYSGTVAGGSGGSGGSGGTGGKIYQVELTGLTPSSSASTTIGSGGSGGSANGGSGSSGGNTSITIAGTTYSSSSGSVSATGFTDELNSITYGLSGDTGTAGGDGGSTTTSNSGAGNAVGTNTGGSAGG